MDAMLTTATAEAVAYIDRDTALLYLSCAAVGCATIAILAIFTYHLAELFAKHMQTDADQRRRLEESSLRIAADRSGASEKHALAMREAEIRLLGAQQAAEAAKCARIAKAQEDMTAYPCRKCMNDYMVRMKQDKGKGDVLKCPSCKAITPLG